MKLTIDSGDRQFLETLHSLESATVQELCDELKVTATAVRQRLTRLQGFEFVSRECLREGRGRPQYRYQLTDTGLKELGDNYSDLAVILWKELSQIDDSEIKQQIFNRIRETLAKRYGQLVDGSSISDRMKQLQKELEKQGFHVEYDETGDFPILRENNCPYLDLAISDRSICELERSVFEQVLGSKVELTECYVKNSRCCEFKPVGELVQVD
jgi:predicted ArsR family transcriptional regulator